MYQIPALLKFPELFHAFSTTDEGNMANSILGKVTNFDEVLKNRQSFLLKNKILIDDCVCMWGLGLDGIQVAGQGKAGVSMQDYTKAVKTDALITANRGLYLFLLVADCAPVILFDTKRKAVAIVHVGWRGANLEIVKKAIKKLRVKYRTNPTDLVVGIGPAARKDSFIKESPSQKHDPRWLRFLSKVDATNYTVDFVGFCNKQLLESGVDKQNILDCGIDTIKDAHFFSHYRSAGEPLEKQGRFACIVGLI